VKVILKFGCIAALFYLWQHTAKMEYCLLFWVTLLGWAVAILIRSKIRGGFLILLGVTSNALVTSLNGGIMPTVGLSTYIPDHPIWDVSGHGRWLMLADQAALYRFSIGDILLITGGVTLLGCKVYSLVKHKLRSKTC